MQATPIKIDIEGGFSKVTLYVQDLKPFTQNMGKQIELSVTEVEQPTMPPPAAENNVVQLSPTIAGESGNMAAKPEVVTRLEPYAERPISSSGVMGAANADNPNACPLCYGHGLVKEFRGGNDITGTPAVCKTCGGTGIKPAEAAAATDTGAIKPCTECGGSGSESPGKRCQRCEGTGTEPANPPATHNED